MNTLRIWMLNKKIRELVLKRDSHICQRCFRSDCQPIDPHHMKFKSRGGSDDPINLITLGRLCHRSVHDHKQGTEMFRTHRWQKEGETELNVH